MSAEKLREINTAVLGSNDRTCEVFFRRLQFIIQKFSGIQIDASQFIIFHSSDRPSEIIQIESYN